MTEKTDKTDKNWAGKAALAGAAIGSAALAAAVLFASRRKEKTAAQRIEPPHPEEAPETD
ncbi:hypothetical protein MB02_11435 [Croceicoccus estronivorus]|uniref:hypothetical protein n=1 Tax=Croceicoccus estronivorus TaxID=1172626 RepID=UPI0008305CA4|nr:hypothetical protein [Croceicoccus estronivorus]OCC23254.1 hypothetical protein MB02_11435 [Croceicoccus estronivorus]